jgi:uncharacterized protein (TIRG00374 family)
MPPGNNRKPRRWRWVIPKWARNSVVILLALLVVEYLVVPELVGASKNLKLLSGLNVGWLISGVAAEIGSLLCYALLTHTLLGADPPPMTRLIRIVLATTAISHVIPGGAAGGAGLGYQLLTDNGVDGPDAAFTLATQGIGSAVVLNVMLWLTLLVSIPLAGVHPIYVVVALVGLIALLAVAALVYTFTRGEERAVRVVRAVGRRVPRVGADRLEHVIRQVGDSLGHLARDRSGLRRAVLYAALNWGLDAVSLWCFLAALGRLVNPFELFAAYGIANVLAVVPITPGGLGIIEASAASLIVSFGSPRSIATLAVLGWRLVNFWLPIPLGALAYLSLKVPRGSGLRVKRDALTAITAEAKRSGDVSPASTLSAVVVQQGGLDARD